MTATAVKNDRRSLFGWAMYDWANSAYATTVAGALLPAFFAEEVVPEEGFEILGRTVGGETLWAAVVGVGAFALFLLTPVLGAIADYTASKRRFLQVFAYGGALFTTTLFFVGSGDVLLTLGLFFAAHLGFVGANVFYDGFLPDLTTDDSIDRQSARGYAFGYVGGGLQLLLAAALLLAHDSLGIGEATAARTGVAMAGLWWAGFTWYALARIPETGTAHTLPGSSGVSGVIAHARLGFGRTWATARRLVRFRQLLLFVVAYMLFIDGVQTVIAMTSVYASDTLDLSTETILVGFLIAQFVAFAGALAFGRLAGRLGARDALLVAIGVWAAVAVAAYFLPEGAATPFYALAAVVGLVLGGVQALSRSLYGSMIPEEASAEFFGFFSVFGKFSAIWGPLIFVLVNETTGSARNSILSLIVFFVAGGLLLAKVDVGAARASRDRWRFAGDEVDVAG